MFVDIELSVDSVVDLNLNMLGFDVDFNPNMLEFDVDLNLNLL